MNIAAINSLNLYEKTGFRPLWRKLFLTRTGFWGKFAVLIVLGIAGGGTVPVPAQTVPRNIETLKNYVGYVTQTFEPEFAGFMRELKGEFERRGLWEAAGSIENYLGENAGTGVVYVAPGGANYIITGYRNISLASGLSIHFERAVYDGLSIVAADEELDIALLSFENGARPFTRGLSPLERQTREGEWVCAAGFSGAGAAWQFGEGHVSGTYVRLPGDTTTMPGSYIRHTAKTDQEISGGVLLAVNSGTLTGYSLAGISAASNAGQNGDYAYAIPIDRIADFFERALGGDSGDARTALEERLLAFSRIMGLSAPYQQIADWLSTAYIMENIAGILPVIDSALGTAVENIVKAFIRSPALGIKTAAAWGVENYLRKGNDDAIGAEVETIERIDDRLYHTDLSVSGTAAGAVWVYERDAWRIRSFDTGPDDNPMRKKEEVVDGLKPGGGISLPQSDYLFSVSAGYGLVFNKSHNLMVESSLHLQLLALTVRLYYGGSSYLRPEFLAGFHFPIQRLGLIPFAGAGVGFVRGNSGGPAADTTVDLYISGQAGVRITTNFLAQGLFLQGMYQYNSGSYPHTLTVSVGYGF
jgi:hypothetical protein